MVLTLRRTWWQGMLAFTACLLVVYLAALRVHNPWAAAGVKLKVLCTTQMIQALVSEIGGIRVHTVALVCGEVDPHSYQLVKGDRERIAQADLIFANGLDLEHHPSLHTCLKAHARSVFLGDHLAQLQPQLIIDHEGIVDPHLWLDPSVFSQLCPLIAQHLAALDPNHESDYLARSERLQQELASLHKEIVAGFDRIPDNQKYLITSHAAFAYFARAYLSPKIDDAKGWRERACAPEGMAPESQISLSRIIEIANYATHYQVHAGFYECNVNRDALYKLYTLLHNPPLFEFLIPKEPLYSDSMPELIAGESYKEAYFRMIRHNKKVILDAWHNVAS